MNVAAKAIEKYMQGNYQEAIVLFEKAGEIYGHHLFRYNISKCQAKILIDGTDQGRQPGSVLSNNGQLRRKT